jgi:hypothetical protein
MLKYDKRKARIKQTALEHSSTTPNSEQKMSPHPPIVRWGLVLPLAAVALAFYLSLDDQVQNILSSLSPSPQERHCYQGVRTAFSPDSAVLSADCFTVQDGKFVQVSAAAPAGEQEDVQAGYAYPGLWDGHGHLLQYGEFLHSVDLFRSESFDEVRRRLLGYLDRNPGVGGPDEWIRGVGWDQMALGAMPTAVCSRLASMLNQGGTNMEGGVCRTC